MIQMQLVVKLHLANMCLIKGSKRQIYYYYFFFLMARAGGFLEQYHWTDTLNTGAHVAREHICEQVFVLPLL